MTTNVDICNLAISEVGTQGSMIAALTDTSIAAKQCNLWYDRIRKNLLRAAPWGFSRYQAVMTLLGTLQASTAPWPYLFKYAYPTDCIKLRYLVPPPVQPVQGVPQTGEPIAAPYLGVSRDARFIVSSDQDSATPPNEIKVILSNLAPLSVVTTNDTPPFAVYNRDITNVALFDDLFIDAMVAALSYRLVMPLSGNIGQREQYRESAEAIIMKARAMDGNEAHPTTDHTPDWISIRGTGWAWGSGFVAGTPGWGQWYGTWDDMNWGM